MVSGERFNFGPALAAGLAAASWLNSTSEDGTSGHEGVLDWELLGLVGLDYTLEVLELVVQHHVLGSTNLIWCSVRQR
jgi:hypothetical protein